ncbi:MAG TPA: CBS domain-containing protein [Polyangia bacterium]|nr:CBS domain-containing protein [Polyangia bacterium]
MKCSDIVSKNVERLYQGDTVDRAAEIMAEAQVGFLPVCDEHQKVLGVVTDRDLVTRVLAKRLEPRQTSVRDIMSTPALTCFIDADLHVAEELMQEEGKMHLVLTHADGALAGVVGVADIVENAPTREAIRTLRSVEWRDALGPRGGAEPGQPLLKDEPPPPDVPEADRPHASGTVFARGRREADTREFPGG